MRSTARRLAWEAGTCSPTRGLKQPRYPRTFKAPHGAIAAARPKATTGGLPTQRRAKAETPPLGSILSDDADGPALCGGCGQSRTNRVQMTLADGTRVTFQTCHDCAHTRWLSADDGFPVTLADILSRATVRKATRPHSP